MSMLGYFRWTAFLTLAFSSGVPLAATLANADRAWDFDSIG